MLKTFGLPRLMLPVGRVWFSLCVPIVGILQSLSSNAFPTGLTHHISKGVTSDTSCRRYECMGTLYHKLVAFIPPAKDEWDFCRRVLKFEVYITMLISLMPLMATIYISFPKTKETSHGYARWANSKDIECFKIFSKEGFCKVVHRLGVQFDNGFILGKFGFPKLRDVCYDKPLGAMIVAPPGAGKTACVALPNLLTLPNSCIITDIKGELRDKTAGYRQKFLNNRILIFNPYGDDNTCYFNPFDKRIVKPMNFDQRLRLVQENANNVFISEEKGEDHWVLKLKICLVFMPCMMFVPKMKQTFLMSLWVQIEIMLI